MFSGSAAGQSKYLYPRSRANLTAFSDIFRYAAAVQAQNHICLNLQSTGITRPCFWACRSSDPGFKIRECQYVSCPPPGERKLPGRGLRCCMPTRRILCRLIAPGFSIRFSLPCIRQHEMRSCAHRPEPLGEKLPVHFLHAFQLHVLHVFS